MGGHTVPSHSLCNRLYSWFYRIKRGIKASARLIAASLGANIFYTRLTGMVAPQMPCEASVSAWMQDLAEAFEIGITIGDKVIIISAQLVAH